MSAVARIPLAILFAVLLTWHAFSDVKFNLTVDQLSNQTGAIQLGENGQYIGSGFVFGPQHDVVTCWHVKNGAEGVLHQTNLVFCLPETNSYRLKLKYMLPKYDLAVFTSSPGIKTASCKSGDFKKLRPGDIICYVGYDAKLSTLYEWRSIVHGAQIAAVGCALNDGVVVDFLEFVGQGLPGYSGGAVFNADGEVVAVMREAWTKKGVAGGPEMLINRAFSVEILSVLNEQLLRDAPAGAASTNGVQIGVVEILSLTNK
jgi:S1-C subfamily serine protease